MRTSTAPTPRDKRYRLTRWERVYSVGMAELTREEILAKVAGKESLKGANLSGANLSVTRMSYADMRGADLTGADLNGANLNEANLSTANLNGAKLENVIGTYKI